MGENGNRDRLYFCGLQNHCRWWLQPWNKKTLAPWKKSYDQPRQHIKKQRHPLSGDCSSASIGSAFTLFFGNQFLHGDKMATIRPDIDPMPSVTPTGEMILSLFSPRKTSECIFLSLFLSVPSLKHHYSQLEENDLIVQAWVNCSSLEVMGKNSFQITGSKIRRGYSKQNSCMVSWKKVMAGKNIRHPVTKLVSMQHCKVPKELALW